MEGIKLIVFCCILLKFTKSAPISTSKELIQKLEAQIEELTETLEELKRENFNHAKRQAVACILNGNGEFNTRGYSLYKDRKISSSNGIDGIA